MDADFAIELGREDPVLDLPWNDPSGKLAYVDLKRHPELLTRVEEAKHFPELADLLQTLNSATIIVETAKCDAWATTDLSPEEEIYGASHKFASYVDVVFSESARRASFPAHELFARELVEVLQRATECPSTAEVCVRRCYFEQHGRVQEGFYLTLYISGYGSDAVSARKNWGIGLGLIGSAVAQLSAV